MLFLPPPALFQLPGSPFSLLKSQISPLFCLRSTARNASCIRPRRKISSHLAVSGKYTDLSVLFPDPPAVPSVFIPYTLFLLYIYVQAAEAEQPNGCPAEQPGQEGNPLPFRYLPDKQKDDGFS